MSTLVQLFVVFLIACGCFGHNIREECSDLYTDQTMKVGAKWSSIGECGPMECKFINLPRARNERFAIALKVDCNRWKKEQIKQEHCTVLKESVDQEFKFAECCQFVICVEGSVLTLYGTDQEGDPKAITKLITGENAHEVSYMTAGSALDLYQELTIEP